MTYHTNRVLFGPWRFVLRAAVACFIGIALAGQAGAWTLEKNQRRAYLHYYAPLILKQANESRQENWGYDWITNYDFDRDGNFATNRKNWHDKVGGYVANPSAAQFTGWKIRPTLYTALVEFQTGADKSVVLMYHVYHAQEENASIHDWERIEVRIDKVAGTPGTGAEAVAYVVVTTHSDHVGRRGNSVKYMDTPNGRHPIIWQAEWNDSGYSKNELHHGASEWSAFSGNLGCNSCPAQIDIADGNGIERNQEVHYAFVPDGDADAVATWNAVALTHANAASQAAKTASRYNGWTQVKRLTYELQDIADILPTQAATSSCNAETYPTEHGWARYNVHWDTGQPNVGIWLEKPLKSEDKTTLVPKSTACTTDRPVTFYRYSEDVLGRDDAQGYSYKHWFWGAYKMNGEGDTDGAFNGRPVASNGPAQVRLCTAGHKKYWCQYDFYAHTGEASNSANHGRWLPEGWHKKGAGGFDGRWDQLFDDQH
jgi:hypothetical protein